MRCISLWQPWAALWLLSNPDEKVFETRSWYTGYRGPMLVHAAKKQDREINEAVYDLLPSLIPHGIHGMAQLPFGVIIGAVDLVGCSRMDRMPEPSERERGHGDWSPERFAWERGPKPLLFREPIPYRGAQGIFNVPDSLSTEFVDVRKNLSEGAR